MTKNLFTSLLVISFLNFAPLACLGQYYELKITPITDQNGQLAGGTFSIAEDKDGFIWFGTLNGLVRYDGYNFKSFKHQKDDSNSLSNNMIRALHVDSQGLLWIGTQGGGLNSFNTITETFRHYKHDPNNEKSLSNNDVWSIEEDKNGNLWVGTWAGGLNKFDKQKEEFSCYQLSIDNSQVNVDGIRSIFADDDGTLWIGMHSSGIVMISSETGEVIRRFLHNPNEIGSITSNEVYHIFRDQSRRLWISTLGGGINLYDEDKEIFRSIRSNPNNVNSLSSDFIYRIMQTRSGEYWVAHDRTGVTTFNPDNNLIRSINQSTSNGNALSSDRIRFLLEDSNGIIWVGSEIGVDKIVENKNFRVYRYVADNPNSLNTRVVRSIYQDRQGLIWIGAYDTELMNINPQTNQFNKTGKLISSIKFAATTAMMEDRENNFWVGTNNGVYVFNSEHNLIHLFFHEHDSNNTITDNTIQIIRQGNNDDIWIGTENGLNIYNTRTKNWTNFINNPNKPNSLSSNKIQPNALIIQEDGVAWAGTWAGGLNKYIPEKGTFKRFTHNPNNSTGISNNNVLALHKCKNGFIWVGTFGGGLNRFDPKSEEFKAYTEIEGLPNNIVFAIHPDKNGFLWLSTDNGLSRFNPETEEFLNFDVNDGLPSNQFFWGSSFESHTGQLFFGGTDGLISFFPEEISLNTRIPPIFVTDVKVYNESVRFEKATSNISRIEFSHKIKNFQIEFIALDYTVPTKNQYAYKLSGGDKNWIPNGNRNYVNFMNIAPGNYKLCIKGSNNDGVWNEKGIVIDLIITPAIWQTTWFRIVFFIIIFLMFFSIYKARTYQIKQQKKELELLVKLRTEELEATNEELRSINEELYSQREELESTLLRLQNTQNQLVKSEKLASLGLLAAGVAHEINNPLNFIQGGISAIENYIKENMASHLAELSPMLEIINTGVFRTASIVTSLNHYSRRDDLKYVVCNIHTVIDNCLLMLNNLLKNRIRIEKNYTTKPFSFYCNEAKMHQAVLNILSNAENSIEGEGVISIQTQVKEGNLIIIISDNGCGISKEDLLRVTDPFFTTKEPGKGTGLGLSITLNIIEELKGTLEFKSEVGKGTIVEISLPLRR